MRPRLPQVALATLLSIWLVMAPHRALPQASQSLTTASVVQVGKFTPSNARTEDGELIPAEQFFPARRCAKCHQDTHAAWSESLHRNAAREPFYKASVDILHDTKGPKLTQHCESCHSPVAVFSGDLLTGGNTSQAMEDEGVSCVVCHSIVEARVDGTGSYTIRRPALLVREDGVPVFGDLPDAAIMTDIAGHKRAMMRPLLKQPEFCGVCHKSVAPPELNSYKFLRGFSAYDEWQQSGASMEAVTPFYRRDERLTCNACHMPSVESTNDVGAKNGLLASHRWLGANTITPLFYKQTKQVELTEKFLQSHVLNVDIFALKREATGETFTALATENRIVLQPDEEVTVDVVIANRKAAHSFPPELRDMYEPWVEFEAVDGAGNTIFHSGFIKPDQALDESAHVYKAILLDEASRPITRHQVWLARSKAYDNFISQGRCDLARYRFRVPKTERSGAPIALTLRARVNYRRFIQEYTEFVLQQKGIHLVAPIVRMAETEVTIGSTAATAKGSTSESSQESLTPDQQARRWNDYGIALLEQSQYGPAADAFRQAYAVSAGGPRGAGSTKGPDPDPLISAAICEMKTERFGPERDQLRKAATLLKAALKIDPTLPRAHFYHALLMRSEGKSREAAEELAQIARDYPRDREVQRQLGQTLYSLGRMAEARVAFEAVLAIDPTDAGAYQFLSTIYRSEKRQTEADRARALYLLWRDDPLADPIAARFFETHPEWADERVWAHVHGHGSPARPTLTGRFASPDK